jgi:choline dehydrogenase-like flavoprotein
MLAMAEAAMPAGQLIPAPTTQAVDRVDELISELPPALSHAYRGVLHALDLAAWVAHRRGLAALSPGDRLAVMEQWRRGGPVRRNLLRATLTPLKVAHFDNPGLYRSLGCVYEFAPPASPPSAIDRRIHRADDGASAIDLECDVVVVGTGAGGAVVGKELADAGLAVVFVEEGAYFDRSHFTGRPYAMQRAMYRRGGATFTLGNTVIPIPVGRTVGGSTTINSGTCFRPPERVLRHWQRELGLGDLGPEQLADHFARVESILGVATARAEFLGGNARVIARGCEALGLKKHGPLRRNAPDCDGKGVCCFGCPTDAKRSTNVSYIPLALRAGAELFTGYVVRDIVHHGGRARGVIATAGAHTLHITARAVVVAAGTLFTPGLLRRNGLAGRSGQLGKNLSIHPAAGVFARFAERIAGWDAIPQGYGIEDFHDEGLLFEGVATPLEFAMGAAPIMGPELTALAEAFDQVASFGFLVEDSSRGVVSEAFGEPLIRYRLNQADVSRIKQGVDILARVFLAAGASEVLTPIAGAERITSADALAQLRARNLSALDLDLSAYHPLGTARMGAAPATSVVGADHQVHDLPGLYVVDGSAVPSALGVNPQVTIMALATRAAQLIARALA